MGQVYDNGSEGGTSGEFLRKAEPFVLALGHSLRGDGYNDLSLLFPNGSRLVGLPGKESTTRGFSAVSLMLIDEAAAVQDAMYHALTPMLAISRGDLWLMSTPRGKQGFFYDEWSRGGEAWHRIQATGPECSRIDPVFLEDERRSKGEARYRQEYLCEFVAPEGALFDEEAIRRLIVDEFEPLVLA